MEDGVDSNPVKINLQRIVTIPRKLNMDQRQDHLTSESQMTQETIALNRSDGSEEMEEVVWCFIYVKATKLTENYKATCEIWRKRNQSLRTNIEAKLLLKQRNDII
jgi:hypothetical protein